METYTTEPAAPLPIIPASMPGDMRLVAWVSIIQGGLMCLSIIGAIVGIPLLISGLRLKEAADGYSDYDRTGMSESLARGIESQSRYFFIQKIFIIIGLVVFVGWIIFMIVMFAGAISSGSFDAIMRRGPQA